MKLWAIEYYSPNRKLDYYVYNSKISKKAIRIGVGNRIVRVELTILTPPSKVVKNDY